MPEKQEESKQQEQGNLEAMTHIKTLFSRLTELIMAICVTRRGVADAIVAVGNWASITFAAMIVMICSTHPESITKADQICEAMNKEMKKHIIVMRGMKNKAK